MKRYFLSATFAVSLGFSATILTVLLGKAINAQEPADVTMVQLIANPERFDGKLIRVIGFLRLEFEGNILYLHREDYDYAILGNGIWVDVSPEVTKQSKALNMSYVLLEGVFDSRDRGHMGMWSGSIEKVRRAQVWPSRPRKNNELPPRPTNP